MADIINDEGTVNTCSGAVLSAGLSEEECKARGLTFVRTYKVPPPMTLHSLSPCKMAGHEVYFTLWFKSDRLWQVSFTFLDGDDNQRKKLDTYKEFLQRAIGPPKESNPNNPNVSYSYSWGRVTASYDPRNDSSGMYVSWNVP